jgi:spore coat polysaccharide biosynthesis predicted glycosyltransferase SpsG
MNIPPKIFFLSDSGNSNLAEFINTNLYFESFDVSFKKLRIENLQAENPDLIVIDLYFSEKYTDEVVANVLKHFGNKPIYFLSPINNEIKKLVVKLNTNIHFLSNFSGDVVRKINQFLNSAAIKNYGRVG